jgi:hypothetical protein
MALALYVHQDIARAANEYPKNPLRSEENKIRDILKGKNDTDSTD